MKSFMDINEKMALYVFGCADLDVTVANLHGAASLITDSGIKFMLDRLAQKLGFFIFEDDGYMDLFYEIRLEVSQALMGAHILYEKVTGDVENDFPWRNFVKALITDSIGTGNCLRDLVAVRILRGYIPDEKIKAIVEEIYHTLDIVKVDDQFGYLCYLSKFKSIVRGYHRLPEGDSTAVLKYMWEVPDVEIE